MNASTNGPPPSSPQISVSGRVFVITGGTQGLGLAIARLLKGRGASGMVLVARSENRGELACAELSDESCGVGYISADLGKAEDASSVIPRAVELMKDIGPITGVVNAAATTDRGNLFTESAKGFDRQFAVNVRAPFLITQAAAKHMVEQNVSGGIVNICSVASYGGAPFVMAYSASKAALVNLTKNNAAELAPKGIRVNGINMGWCLTENENMLQKKQSDENWVDRADESVPLGRILRPEDVASSVGYLLSNASAMVTGSILELHPEFSHGMLSLLDNDSR
mmetsp:Transcript_10336/g.30460  ORF Transcript_10336/g.30460 Transcript_10336/m.30460 type:complete len:282 (-) Transcript_10336:58-903(-)